MAQLTSDSQSQVNEIKENYDMGMLTENECRWQIIDVLTRQFAVDKICKQPEVLQLVAISDKDEKAPVENVDEFWAYYEQNFSL